MKIGKLHPGGYGIASSKKFTGWWLIFHFRPMNKWRYLDVIWKGNGYVRDNVLLTLKFR
jgi:hypothetical protein